MGSGPAKPDGNQPSFLYTQETGKATGAEDSPPPKAESQRQALEMITNLLANPEALDALCRDLFESMSGDDGSKCISRSRLSMLTRLVINSCQVSDPSSLQELLDVLVPLHSQLLEDGEDTPQMEYEGFLPHARCVLRVVDAVLQVELKGHGIAGFHKTVQDLAVLEQNGNGSHGEHSIHHEGGELFEEETLMTGCPRRRNFDDRAVIITTEDLRDARGSVSIAAAVAEAAMPESVVPEPLCEPMSRELSESEMTEATFRNFAFVQEGPPRSPTRSPRIAANDPIAVVRPPMFGDPRLLWQLPMASPRATTPSLSSRAPPLSSITGNMAAACSRACVSRRPLQQSVSSSSLILDSSSMSSMAELTGIPTRMSRGSTPIAPTRTSAPTASLPSSRSTTPRPVVQRSVVGPSTSSRATPRRCSPQCRTECIPVSVPSATSAMTSLPELPTINGTARSQSPTRPSTGCIRTPVGPLCVAPMTARVPRGSIPTVVAPPGDSLAAPGGRSTSPLRPGSHLWATTLPHPSRSGM